MRTASLGDASLLIFGKVEHKKSAFKYQQRAPRHLLRGRSSSYSPCTAPDPLAGPQPARRNDLALESLRQDAHKLYRSAMDQRNAGGLPGEDVVGRARSMVELYLYRLLEASTVTRGVFELNALLPIEFGTHRLEADFASRRLRIVLEVDGYYHFTDLDAYRRDRRKDLVLQQHGYLIARMLADDILERSSEVQQQVELLVQMPRQRIPIEEE